MDDDFAAAAVVDPSILDMLGRSSLRDLPCLHLYAHRPPPRHLPLLAFLYLHHHRQRRHSRLLRVPLRLHVPEALRRPPQRAHLRPPHRRCHLPPPPPLLLQLPPPLVTRFFKNYTRFSGSFFALSFMGGSSSSPSSAFSSSLSMKPDLISIFFELCDKTSPFSAKTPPSTPFSLLRQDPTSNPPFSSATPTTPFVAPSAFTLTLSSFSPSPPSSTTPLPSPPPPPPLAANLPSAPPTGPSPASLALAFSALNPFRTRNLLSLPNPRSFCSLGPPSSPTSPSATLSTNSYLHSTSFPSSLF